MTTRLSVFLDGALAGSLTQSRGGAVTFAYDGAHLTAPDPTPLSLSMPLDDRVHPNRVVTAWLEGLLPDNLAVREAWGRRFQVSPRNAFSLLRHVGRDAAGAVQVLLEGQEAPDAARRTGSVQVLSDADMATLLADLTREDRGWEVGATSGRWSLAGAQNKVALHRLGDGTWAVPLDSTPTTHILKPTRAVTRFADLHANEFVCLRAAGLLGLRAAQVDLTDVGGAATLIATRYDRGRAAGGGGRWVRLHQEDLLQALSVRPEKKYQSDGAPDLTSIAQLFATLSLPDREYVCSAFFDALAFNVLVGGTDAHAKNYSLLLRGSRVALAPMYDVASYAPYLASGEQARSSMKVGRHWQVWDMTAEDWALAGAALHLSRAEALERVEYLRRGLPDALSAAAEAAPAPFRDDATRVAAAIAHQPHLRGDVLL